MDHGSWIMIRFSTFIRIPQAHKYNKTGSLTSIRRTLFISIQAYPFILFTLTSKSTGSYVGITNNHWIIQTQSQLYNLVHGLFNLDILFKVNLHTIAVGTISTLSIGPIWKQGSWNWIHTQLFITALHFNIGLVWSVFPRREKSALHVVQSGSWFIRPGQHSQRQSTTAVGTTYTFFFWPIWKQVTWN
jgi:hypothetical protein